MLLNPALSGRYNTFRSKPFKEEQVSMALEDKIEAVKKVGKALDSKPMEPEIERVPPNKEHFDSLMSTEQSKDAIQKQRLQEAVAIEKTDKINPKTSPLEQVRNLNKKVHDISKLSPEDLKNQVKDVIAQMDVLKENLANSTEIKPSYQSLMHNRLTHIDDNIKVALSKAGIEHSVTEAPTTAALNNTQLNPLERFLGFITHGQYQLEHLSSNIGMMTKAGTPMSPGDMLQIQIKVGQIQQEIELFTNSLNKALEATKTLMNTQV